jgi:hypothetical protein
VFVIELRDSVVSTVVQTVMNFDGLEVRLEVQSISFVSFSILFFTLHIP